MRPSDDIVDVVVISLSQAGTVVLVTSQQMSHLVVKFVFEFIDQFLLRLQPVTDSLPRQPSRLSAGQV